LEERFAETLETWLLMDPEPPLGSNFAKIGNGVSVAEVGGLVAESVKVLGVAEVSTAKLAP
jgi:hypothetical protein